MDLIKKNTKLSDLSKIIIQASLAGATELLRYHKQNPINLNIRFKQDTTPVTIADEKSEQIITKILRLKLPNSKIYGEEEGISGHIDSDMTVFIDPLDGTNPFIHGQKFSTVGIMICDKKDTLAAAICLPFDKELIVAEKGKGTYLFRLSDNLKIIHKILKLSVSNQNKLDGSVLYIDANFSPQKNSIYKINFLNKLVTIAEENHMKFSIRMIGSNLNQQAQIAAGRGDITITDCIGGYYDLTGDLIIREAGGQFTDENGKAVSETTKLAIGSNGLIQTPILSLIKECFSGYAGFN